MYDAIVVGGGQAGLATSYRLKNTGLNHLVLHGGVEPSGSWPQYYDSLKLFSPARYSSLPGMDFPGDPDRYPVRDEVTAYLRSYAGHFDLPVQCNTSVATVSKEGGRFQVTDSEGNTYEARTIVATSGSFNRPFVPHIEGQDAFGGHRIHAIEYRKPDSFTGKRVVVVGAANTAVQVAVELAAVAEVSLAVRNKVQFVPQRLLGKDFHFWLGLTGLDKLRLLKDQSTPVLDSGDYRKAVRSGKPDVRSMFTAFSESGVVWADGTHENVDTVIFATGYRPNLTYLESLPDSEKNHRFRFGVSQATPGLYCMGFSGQRSFASATLRGVGPDSAYIMRHLPKYLMSEISEPARHNSPA